MDVSAPIEVIGLAPTVNSFALKLSDTPCRPVTLFSLTDPHFITCKGPPIRIRTSNMPTIISLDNTLGVTFVGIVVSAVYAREF